MPIADYILISPYSRRLRNGKENPKNYPFWPEVIKQLDCRIIQIGVTGEASYAGTESIFNAPLEKVSELVKGCITWAAVDNFLPHLAHLQKKKGVAIFGKSDPLIFGHPENINLLKDRKYLRPLQFDIWERETFDAAAFVGPEMVVKSIREVTQNG